MPALSTTLAFVLVALPILLVAANGRLWRWRMPLPLLYLAAATAAYPIILLSACCRDAELDAAVRTIEERLRFTGRDPTPAEQRIFDAWTHDTGRLFAPVTAPFSALVLCLPLVGGAAFGDFLIGHLRLRQRPAPPSTLPAAPPPPPAAAVGPRLASAPWNGSRNAPTLSS